MATVEAPNTPTWVGQRIAMETFGATYPEQLRRLVRAGRVRCLKIPGSYPRYCLEDLQSLVREHTIKPGELAEAQ